MLTTLQGSATGGGGRTFLIAAVKTGGTATAPQTVTVMLLPGVLEARQFQSDLHNLIAVCHVCIIDSGAASRLETAKPVIEGVPMSEHPNAAVLRSAYEAMAKGDPAFLEALDDDILWHESTAGYEGDYRGRDQVMALMGQLMQGTGVQISALTIHDVLASDDHAVILHEDTLTRQGRTYVAQYIDVYHIRNGKATEHWHMAVDPKADAEFFGS